ncbi:6-bladed beta-propeller [Algoriphagus sp. AGSA1]|uniref:6-bladed beta-propeller n=1 Tax=Algoriphagus sp. AGSA1 TaxID=2907213 RepID=UPI001F27404A|nr:6-bladed beta-propeller [Algoriphagus sp. AGSA1]MCE7057466.1 6-bladed beta-propeller [Algoriphagus sp. AGSA1]
MVKLKIFCVLILYTFSSCTHSDKKVNVNESDVKIDLENSKQQKLSSIFNEISYTLLRSDEKVPLVEPYQIIIKDKFIYVHDYFNSNIHRFDREGNVDFIYKAKGQGPAEYQQLDFFQVREDSLLILDRSLRKIIVYDSKQLLIEEEKIPKNASQFTEKDGKTLFFMNNIKDRSDYNFLLFEGATLLGEFVKIKQDFEKFQFGGRNGFISGFDNEIIFTLPYSRQVIFFDGELNFKQVLKFDLGSWGVNELDFIRLNSVDRETYQKFIRENQLVENISMFTPLGDFYFMSLYQYSQGIHFILLDREFNIVSQISNFENDIDEMRIRNIPWTFDKECIVFSINSIDFYNDYVKKFTGKQVEIETGNIHDFFQANKEELMNDQTVLVSLKLRNDLSSVSKVYR